MIQEYRLLRTAASLVHVEQLRPPGARILRIRYTLTEVVVIYLAKA